MIKDLDFGSKKKLEDNPNPNAKIGFVTLYPFHVYVYKNVYKYLKDKSEFIVDLGAFFPTEQPEDLADEIISLLKKYNARFRILYYDDYFYDKYIEKFCSKYEMLVALWWRSCITHPCNVKVKKITLSYGAGKNLNTLHPNRRKMDFHLTYGKYDDQLLSLYTPTKIVGNPKFDDWFNNEFDQELLDNLAHQLNPKKKTVLFLPTHGDLCSIDDLAVQLKKIPADYNIITKVHYYWRREPERLKKLQHPNIILLSDGADLLTLFKISDVVLADNSSAIFDAILADKPLALADFLSKEFFETEHRKPKHYELEKYSRLIKPYGMTCSGSLEQKIKKDGLAVTFKKPEELDYAVKEALADSDFYKKSRAELREQIFAFNDGKCGERAANAILDLLNAEELPEKHILYYVMDSFENDMRRPLSRERRDTEKIFTYQKLLFNKIKKEKTDKIFFSVIMINEENDKQFTSMVLRSLYEQKFPAENYEVIFNKENADPVLFIKDAIKRARGEVICFISDNCLAPSEWLLNFYLAYQKHPEAGGIGGYAINLEARNTIYNEYGYLGIGRKLGIYKDEHYLKRLVDFVSYSFLQNPAGLFANMSYRKNIIENHVNYPIKSLGLFGMHLKQMVLQLQFPIGFIPSAVRNLEKITFKKFLQKNFKEGADLQSLIIFYPELERYCKYSVFTPLRLSLLNVIDGHMKIRLTAIIFIGNIMRLFGQWYIRFSMISGLVARLIEQKNKK